MRNSARWVCGATALVLLLGPAASRAEADSLGDLLGARAVGLGEAVRASASGASSTQVNPAGATLVRSVTLEAGYGMRPKDDAMVASVAFCDSVTNQVGACLYYNYFGATPDGGTRKLHDVGLTVSIPIAEKLYLGSTTRYVKYSETGTFVDPKDDSRDGEFTMDYGLILKLDPVSVAGVGYNLVGSDAANFPRAVGTGITARFAGDLLALSADAVWNLQVPDGQKTGRYGGGLEVFLTSDGDQQGYPIRAGYVYDVALERQYVTGGLGLVTPRMGLEASVRQQVGGDGKNELLVQVGLRVFMPTN